MFQTISTIIELSNILEKTSSFKTADLFAVYLNNLYIINFDGYIMNKVELETGYCETMFLFTNNELKTPTGISMMEYVFNHKSEYFYIYKNSYIIIEENKNIQDIIINDNFIQDSITGSIIEHLKINRSDPALNNIIPYINTIHKFISIDSEFNMRSNEVFTINNFNENNEFIEMTSGKVSDGAKRFIIVNPINNKKYMFILYKGIIQFKKNDIVELSILDVIKYNQNDQDLFYLKLNTIRKKKTVSTAFMIFINLI